MDNFELYTKLGIDHVLDFSGYDHILFLIVLAVVFVSKEAKRDIPVLLLLVAFFIIDKILENSGVSLNFITENVYVNIGFAILLGLLLSRKTLLLITCFTIGHTITLGMAAFGVLNFRVDIIEFLIPATIFITGIINILRAGKQSAGRQYLNMAFAGIFGLVHGVGFSNYFRIMIGKEEEKILPLAEFALGIEVAQVIIVFVVVAAGALLQHYFRVTKRDWVLVTSAIVIGFTIPMMIERVFW
jgi:hydrogenase/urease accessory protein HupE